jgi:hypothetical protein
VEPVVDIRLDDGRRLEATAVLRADRRVAVSARIDERRLRHRDGSIQAGAEIRVAQLEGDEAR